MGIMYVPICSLNSFVIFNIIGHKIFFLYDVSFIKVKKIKMDIISKGKLLLRSYNIALFKYYSSVSNLLFKQI